MAEPLYTLTGRALDDVRRVVREVLKSPDVIREQSKPSPTVLRVYIGKVDGSGVSARSGTTPGSGTLTVYRVNSSGTLETATDSNGQDITATVYNLSSSAVDANNWIQAKQDLSGTLWVDFEDCG